MITMTTNISHPYQPEEFEDFLAKYDNICLYLDDDGIPPLLLSESDSETWGYTTIEEAYYDLLVQVFDRVKFTLLNCECLNQNSPDLIKCVAKVAGIIQFAFGILTPKTYKKFIKTIKKNIQSVSELSLEYEYYEIAHNFTVFSKDLDKLLTSFNDFVK